MSSPPAPNPYAPETERAPERDEARPAAEDLPPVPRGEVLRRAIAIALWLGLFLGLVPLGNRVVPDQTKAHVSLQTFLLTCQIATLVLGVGLTLALLRRRREGLGFARIPGWTPALSSLFSVPFVFAASSYIAIQIALPTLMEELNTRGAHASQQNAGEFGRALTQAPLLNTLIWGAVLGALGEELFFRGLLWTTITDLTKRLAPSRPAETVPTPGDRAPLSVRDRAPLSGRDRAPLSVRDRALAILLGGGVSTLLCAALFGWMHKDLPGGVGIVRVVSTTCLGLASGVVRQATGGVIACVLLHATYNTLVIGAGRKWFSSAEKPILDGVPNTMIFLAIVGLLGVGVLAFVRALQARRARSAFIPD